MGADEGSDGSANHGSDGSSSHGSDGSYRHKWKMNLGSGEELWRNTVPMVPPRDEESGPGRKSTYQKLFAHQAFMFCLKGATNDTLAELFQVSVRTVKYWLKEHKEFLHAVMAGRKPCHGSSSHGSSRHKSSRLLLLSELQIIDLQCFQAAHPLKRQKSYVMRSWRVENHGSDGSANHGSGGSVVSGYTVATWLIMKIRLLSFV